MSRWIVALTGCKVSVKELILKGNLEVRSRPPRRGAWLRGDMASPNKARFNLRETRPLSRNILLACEVMAHESTRQRMSSLRATEAGQRRIPAQRMTQVT
jgi:hypothetical protein